MAVDLSESPSMEPGGAGLSQAAEPPVVEPPVASCSTDEAEAASGVMAPAAISGFLAPAAAIRRRWQEFVREDVPTVLPVPVWHQEVEEEVWQCLLCNRGLTYGHRACVRHSKNLTWHAFRALTGYIPWIDIVDDNVRCRACDKWASPAHCMSDQHAATLRNQGVPPENIGHEKAVFDRLFVDDGELICIRPRLIESDPNEGSLVPHEAAVAQPRVGVSGVSGVPGVAVGAPACSSVACGSAGSQPQPPPSPHRSSSSGGPRPPLRLVPRSQVLSRERHRAATARCRSSSHRRRRRSPQSRSRARRHCKHAKPPRKKKPAARRSPSPTVARPPPSPEDVDLGQEEDQDRVPISSEHRHDDLDDASLRIALGHCLEPMS